MDERTYEINLKEFVSKLLARSRFILKVTGIFLLIGIVLFFLNFKKSEYTADSILSQQSDNYKMQFSLILSGDQKNDIVKNKEIIPVAMYSEIIASPSFREELMSMNIYVPHKRDSIAFLKYFREMNSQQLTLAGKIRRGITNLIKREDNYSGEVDQRNNGKELFAEEAACSHFLENSIVVNIKDQLPMVSVKTPDAVATFGLTQNILILLRKHIKQAEVSYFDCQLEYLQKLYGEVQVKIGDKQREIIDFDKQNSLSSLTAVNLQKNRLYEEYKALSDLSINLEQRILQINTIKDYTPSVTINTDVINGPDLSVAGGRNLFWIVSFLFLGFATAIFLVITLPYVAIISEGKCFRKWLHHEGETGIN